MAYFLMTFYQIEWFSSICLIEFSDLYITKNCIFCWSLIHDVELNLKPWFLTILIKSGYYIVPSPSTSLLLSLLLLLPQRLRILLTIGHNLHFFFLFVVLVVLAESQTNFQLNFWGQGSQFRKLLKKSKFRGLFSTQFSCSLELGKQVTQSGKNLDHGKSRQL